MILGIESSCDDSSISVFHLEKGIIWSKTLSHKIHKQYGGVVPLLAKQVHIKYFYILLNYLMNIINWNCIQKIAITFGPGLYNSLLVGVYIAQAISIYYSIPLIQINHLQAHAFSVFYRLYKDNYLFFKLRLKKELCHLGFLISGGNTLMFIINKNYKFYIIGQTLDDAAGEVLDKGAKFMGFPYPGGFLIEKYAKSFRGQSHFNKKYFFPVTFLNNFQFSFSGIKTNLKNFLYKKTQSYIKLTKNFICYHYQKSIFDQIAFQLKKILNISKKFFIKSIGLSGGVANNNNLRELFLEIMEQYFFINLWIVDKNLSGDNAEMIAFQAYIKEYIINHPFQDTCSFDPRHKYLINME